MAFCTTCNGYSCATPSEKKYCSHPDIIDHFFYHGEPWFTLDHDTFEESVNQENTELRTLNLDEHMKNDHAYCHCIKKAAPQTAKFIHETADTYAEPFLQENYDLDNDIYFKDLYTYNNFHWISASNNHYRNTGT